MNLPAWLSEKTKMDRQADLAGKGASSRRQPARISVALTSFNGTRYLPQQIESILPQLGPEDELVISDDGSTDGTVEMIMDLARADRRIKLFEGPRRGLIENFANALRYCQGEIIFLSDQDDVWLADKVSRVLSTFAASPRILLVQHDARFADEHLKPGDQTVFQWRHAKRGLLANIVKNRYQGCAMAIRRSLLRAALPFPPDIPMHDQWLGLLAELTGKVVFLDEVLMLYRRHGGNMSDIRPSGLKQMLIWRMTLIRELWNRWRKIRAEKRS